MLRIAVCDESAENLKIVESIVDRVLFARMDYQVEIYQDGEKIEKDVEKSHFDFDLVLLDTYMKKADGKTAEEIIRKYCPGADIIIFNVCQPSGYREISNCAYACIARSMLSRGLERELNRYLDERQGYPETLDISVRGKIYRIPLEHILYFESDVRKILIHTSDGKILGYYGKMIELEEDLAQKGFIRCHQSYLVNSKYVTNISRTKIGLSNVWLPVSRKYWEVFKKGYLLLNFPTTKVGVDI